MTYSDYELVYMVKEDEEVLSLMIKKYEPLFRRLAFSFASKYKYKGIDVEDLVQHCRITMCYIIEKYDPCNDVLFYSYLVICLKRAIKNYTRKLINNPNTYSLEDEGFCCDLPDKYDVDYLVYQKEFEDYIKEFTYDLKFFDSCVFLLRLNNFSYKEIATLLNTNVKKVDNTLLKIRKKLEKRLYNEC